MYGIRRTGLFTLLTTLATSVHSLPQVYNEFDCKISGICPAECPTGQKFDYDQQECKQEFLEPVSNCLDLSQNEIRNEAFGGDTRTIHDCNKDAKCEDYKEYGFVCVKSHQCSDGKVITDGQGLIDLRGLENGCCTERNATLDSTDKKCRNPAEVCCLNPNYSAVPCGIETECKKDEDAIKGFAECGRIYRGIGPRVTGQPVHGDAEPGEFPHMCILYRFVNGVRAYLGGASLIAPNKVLTVAHKIFVNQGKNIYDYRNELDTFSVRCGEHNVKTKTDLLEFQEIPVKQVYINPEYNPSRVHHNLAIVVTRENFVYQEHIGPVCLPSPTDNFLGNSECFSSGWGADSFSKDGFPAFYSDSLRKVQMDLVDSSRCETLLKQSERIPDSFKLHNSWICVGGLENVDTCTGDGGSPHVCKHNNQWVQVGAVAWGLECGQAYPAVYSSVSSDMCWIDWVMSCIPPSSQNKDSTPFVGDLRGVDEGGAPVVVNSVNELTSADCGRWSSENPDLIQKCTVTYSSFDVRGNI